MLGFARGLEACRNKIQDPDVKSTLRDLSTMVYGLADKRAAEVKEAKEKRAEKQKEEAEKKAKEPPKKAPPKPAPAKAPDLSFHHNGWG